MKKDPNSRPPLTEYNEKILALFRDVKKVLREYTDKKSQQYGLTSPQMFVIFYLYRNPGINLHDLTKHLELSKSTVSGIVDRLVSQRVVLREIPEENRRTVRLFLSPDFLQEFNIPEFKEQLLSGLIEDASMEDLNSIIYGLEKLLELINKN